MMRFIVSALASLAMILAATAASATLDVSVVGTILSGANAGSNDTTLAVAGDQVQVDVFITNNGSSVVGATVTAFGADFGIDGLGFDGGSTAETWFQTAAVNGKTGFWAFSGGLENLAGDSTGNDSYYTSVPLPNALTNAAISGAGNIVVFSGLDPNARLTETGGDVGIGGTRPGGAPPFGDPNVNLTGNGAAHARLVFTVLGNGAILGVGNDGFDGGLTDANAPGSAGTINNGFIQIGAVPEPGTALLMGLGLSGLSLAGRRRA